VLSRAQPKAAQRQKHAPPPLRRELVDKRALLEIEEQKRRAEADKLAALTELEKRSQVGVRSGRVLW
jgi:kinesin family protein 3/17